MARTHKEYYLSSFEVELQECITSDQKARYILRSILSLPANSHYISQSQIKEAIGVEKSKFRLELINEVLKGIKSGFLPFDPTVCHQGSNHNLAGWIELIALKAYFIFGSYLPEYAYQVNPPFLTRKSCKSNYSPLISKRYQQFAQSDALRHPIIRWAREFCGLTDGEACLLFSFDTSLELIESTVEILNKGYRLLDWECAVIVKRGEYVLKNSKGGGINFDLSPSGIAVLQSAFTKVGK